MIHAAAIAFLIVLYSTGIAPGAAALLLVCILAYYTAIRAFSIFILWTGQAIVTKPEEMDSVKLNWLTHLGSLVALYATVQSGFVLIPALFAITVIPSIYYSGLSTLLALGIIEVKEDA